MNPSRILLLAFVAAVSGLNGFGSQAPNEVQDESINLGVVGGHEIPPNHWPHLLTLAKKDSPNEPICTATLVANNMVLTAAHCVLNFEPESKLELVVTAGEHNVSEHEGPEQYRNVEKIFIHPKYRFGEYRTPDLALLKVSPSFDTGREVDNTVAAGELWEDGSCPKDKQKCSVVGWGKEHFDDAKGTEVPMQAELPIIPFTKCLKSFVDDITNETHICYGRRKGGRGSCDGDSGGPVMCTCEGPGSVQVGVISWGACGLPKEPMVAIRVSTYRPWVNKCIKKPAKCKHGNGGI